MWFSNKQFQFQYKIMYVQQLYIGVACELLLNNGYSHEIKQIDYSDQ